MSQPTGAPLADGVVRMWWRPGLGSAPGCVDIGWMDNGHVICKLVPLGQAATLVTVVAHLTGDARPAMELAHLVRIAHVAGPWPWSDGDGDSSDRSDGCDSLGTDGASPRPMEAPARPPAGAWLPEDVDRGVGAYEDLGVGG
jgi:hypothetical protein